MAKLKVQGREYEVPEVFTLGELADMEEVAGQNYDFENPGPRGLIAIAYVTIRRVDPTVTVDALRALTPDSIEGIKDEGDPSPPALTGTPAAKPAGKPSSGVILSGDGDAGRVATPDSSGVPA